jgi:peptidoglycan/LPS O-acetylase OafA/YrhL
MAIHEGRGRRLAASVPAFIVGLVGLVVIMHPVNSNGWQAVLFEGLIMPPAIGLVLLFSLERGRSLRAFLLCKPVQTVGITSYGIYLWQQLFTAPKMYFGEPGRILTFLFPLLCLIVPISYLLIERPAIKYGKYLSRRVRVFDKPCCLPIIDDRTTQPV